MADDRNTILADFQACTNIDDIEHAIVVLEQHNWNLMEAVQAAMAPEEHADATSPPLVEDVSLHDEAMDLSSAMSERMFQHFTSSRSEGRIAQESSHHDFGAVGAAFPSTSSNSTVARLLTFNISFLDQRVTLFLPDNERVGKLKELLTDELGVPVAEQQLNGWATYTPRTVVSDIRTLRELNLPGEINLVLTPQTMSCVADRKARKEEEQKQELLTQRLSSEYHLKIQYGSENMEKTLKFHGSKTIQEVKEDVQLLSGISPSKQVWMGWPVDDKKDNMLTLAAAGLTFPVHNLIVRSVTPVTLASPVTSSDEMEITRRLQNVNGESDEEMYDEDFLDTDLSPITKRPSPLMPEGVDDQRKALECFVKEFASRYGECHPVFYIGKLEDALHSSLQCKARERRLFAIYLHHDSSVLSNVFAAQVMCNPAVVDYLSHNFVLWAWDMTSEVNKGRLLTLCSRFFGSVASSTLRSLKADELPILLVISRTRSTNEVVQMMKGNMSVDEMIPQLMHCVEVFQHQLLADIAEEDEREARERIKREQEEAYRESLETDRAKAVARLMEEQEQREKEEEVLRQKKQEEELKRRELAKREQRKHECATRVPPEPHPDSNDSVSILRFRFPHCEPIVRRFLSTQPLKAVQDYVGSRGFFWDEYKLLTTFPRRDLSGEDPNRSLKDLKLYPQDTLTLEEK